MVSALQHIGVMRRLLAALLLVTALGSRAESRPVHPIPNQPKPTFVEWLIKKVIGPIVVEGAKGLVATAVRSAIVAAL
jgi:hypothetical protein